MNSPKDAWATPQYIYDWLNSIYDFDIDLAASDKNAKCPKFYSILDNSLEQSWHLSGSCGSISPSGFLNPPYSNITPWIEKAIAEAVYGFTTVMLIPAPNGEKRDELIFNNATSIIYIIGRVPFIHYKTGNPISGNPRGSCVVEFSKRYRRSPINTYSVVRKHIETIHKQKL